MTRYDYIVAGAGAAGLSLIVHIILSGKLGDKKILLVDRAPKTTNDRTWCFWEKQPGLFDSIVYKRWKNMWFHGIDEQSTLHHITPYEYKMIRGIDFYEYSFGLIREQENIIVQYGNVEEVHSDGQQTYVTVDGKRIYAGYIFNSLPVQIKKEKSTYSLLQHFKGWVIKSSKEVFDPAEPTLMDFRIAQHDDTRFVYLMPFNRHEALVEFTVFSENALTNQEYDVGLNDYIFSMLGLRTTEFSVLSEEVGTIPMTNYQFPASDNDIIFIGSAGGNTKASSGYTFRFIQKHSQQIVDALMNGNSPHLLTTGKKFNFYDSILLKILTEKKLSGALIFTQLFQNNKMHEVFKFLDNETSISEDIKLINTLPKSKFISAAFSHLLQ